MDQDKLLMGNQCCGCGIEKKLNEFSCCANCEDKYIDCYRACVGCHGVIQAKLISCELCRREAPLKLKIASLEERLKAVEEKIK